MASAVKSTSCNCSAPGAPANFKTAARFAAVKIGFETLTVTASPSVSVKVTVVGVTSVAGAMRGSRGSMQWGWFMVQSLRRGIRRAMGRDYAAARASCHKNCAPAENQRLPAASFASGVFRRPRSWWLPSTKAWLRPPALAQTSTILATNLRRSSSSRGPAAAKRAGATRWTPWHLLFPVFGHPRPVFSAGKRVPRSERGKMKNARGKDSSARVKRRGRHAASRRPPCKAGLVPQGLPAGCAVGNLHGWRCG